MKLKNTQYIQNKVQDIILVLKFVIKTQTPMYIKKKLGFVILSQTTKIKQLSYENCIFVFNTSPKMIAVTSILEHPGDLATQIKKES